ncbi:MAG: hypothetical protein ABIR46_04115 [Candidatus Saccharimonadales bacterium]
MRQFGLIIITATVTIMGVVAFKALDAHDNSEVAVQTEQTSSQVASVETVQEVATIERELESLDVESLDADLDASFDF